MCMPYLQVCIEIGGKHHRHQRWRRWWRNRYDDGVRELAEGPEGGRRRGTVHSVYVDFYDRSSMYTEETTALTFGAIRANRIRFSSRWKARSTGMKFLPVTEGNSVRQNRRVWCILPPEEDTRGKLWESRTVPHCYARNALRRCRRCSSAITTSAIRWTIRNPRNPRPRRKRTL